MSESELPTTGPEPASDASQLIGAWPVEHAAAAVIRQDGTVLGTFGDLDHEFPLASVTKLLSAYAVLLAVEEGALELADPAGPQGATVRHLLSHTSGLDFDSEVIRAEPGTRRIYSNRGIEVLADYVTRQTEIPFAEYLREAVTEPLGMHATSLPGSPAAGGVSSARDLARFAAELQNPTLLHPTSVAEATSVVFPGLDGVLPGYGVQRPNDWGLGFEIRNGKSPHWTAPGNSLRTYGHFGQTGTFLWVDPDAGLACVALSDRNFGPWAVEFWPPFSAAVLTEYAN